jgi:predicted dehydrogenase
VANLTATISQNQSRREFLRASAATAVGVGLTDVAHVHAGGSDVIRVGLIGCGSPRGGRGRGAAMNCVNAGPNVKLVAMGDLFQDHLDYTLAYLKKNAPDKIDVSAERCFVGFDAYQKVIDSGIDLVLLAAPPGFRPAHIEAAVKAGKHIFAEKPVAVDGPGVRRVLRACDEARKKNLAVVSGLCWRYDKGMREAIGRVHAGAIGNIVALQCTYNTGALWMVPRESRFSDMEWQCRNWPYFTWLSGDHNVEQHIHSLDKMAWAMKNQYPTKAVGLGGRQVRTGPEYGNIFDHHSVVYEFANGAKLFSNCRQQPGCAGEVADHVYGDKGTCDIDALRTVFSIRGAESWKYDGKKAQGDMYQNEHNELIACIREGNPINDGDWMSKSTLMAIMGRMATYTGQVITWEKALNSKEDLSPPSYEFGPLAVRPVAMPGVTKFV